MRTEPGAPCTLSTACCPDSLIRLHHANGTRRTLYIVHCLLPGFTHSASVCERIPAHSVHCALPVAGIHSFSFSMRVDPGAPCTLCIACCPDALIPLQYASRSLAHSVHCPLPVAGIHLFRFSMRVDPGAPCTLCIACCLYSVKAALQLQYASRSLAHSLHCHCLLPGCTHSASVCE
jgi:hypothetical protein